MKHDVDIIIWRVLAFIYTRVLLKQKKKPENIMRYRIMLGSDRFILHPKKLNEKTEN